MTLGTGPQRIARFIEDNWQATRAGRGDVPDVIEYQTGGADPRLNEGVLVVRDRANTYVDTAKHDLIHVYHPEAAPPVEEDNGYKEKRVVETVQVDIELTDRTDPADDSARLDATARMVGDRDDLADTSEPPYPGIWGETRYVLETVRRGLDEWDTVRQDPVNTYLGHTNANVSIHADLEQIATNTVQ